MSVAETYRSRGASLLEGLFQPEVMSAMASQLAMGVKQSGQQFLAPPSLGNSHCYEVYCYHWPVLLTFLWGLTPKIEEIVGKSLLPTYSYFRTYQHGDVCRVHFDRPACEHSLSLTLAYSDAIAWPLAVALQPVDMERHPTRTGGDPDFGSEPYAELPMAPGDGVLYRGLDHRHGRIRPNPNRWSAHLFMHWVDRHGPHAEQAFDRRPVLGEVDFQFPAHAPEHSD